MNEPYPGYAACAAHWRDMVPKLDASLAERFARWRSEAADPAVTIRRQILSAQQLAKDHGLHALADALGVALKMPMESPADYGGEENRAQVAVSRLEHELMLDPGNAALQINLSSTRRRAEQTRLEMEGKLK